MQSNPIARTDGMFLYVVSFTDRNWRQKWSTVTWASSDTLAVEVARANPTCPDWADQGMASVVTEGDVKAIFGNSVCEVHGEQ